MNTIGQTTVLCRACAMECTRFKSLYNYSFMLGGKQTTLKNLLTFVTDLKFLEQENPKLPGFLCIKCTQELANAYLFKMKVINADKLLRFEDEKQNQMTVKIEPQNDISLSENTKPIANVNPDCQRINEYDHDYTTKYLKHPNKSEIRNINNIDTATGTLQEKIIVKEEIIQENIIVNKEEVQENIIVKKEIIQENIIVKEEETIQENTIIANKNETFEVHPQVKTEFDNEPNAIKNASIMPSAADFSISTTKETIEVDNTNDLEMMELHVEYLSDDSDYNAENGVTATKPINYQTIEQEETQIDVVEVLRSNDTIINEPANQIEEIALEILPDEGHDNEDLKENVENPLNVNTELEDFLVDMIVKPNLDETSIIECEICQKKIKSMKYYKQHVELHSNEATYKCKECDEAFKTPNALKGHSSTHVPNICKICGKSYLHQSSLKYHMKFHNGELLVYNCHICGKKFHKKWNYQHHIATHTRSNVKNKSKKFIKDYSDLKMIECKICSKKISRNAYERHIELHSDKKPFKCKVCGEGFKSYNARNGHASSHKPNVCEICGKAYLQKSSLKSHMKFHTGDIVVINCHICGKKFNKKWNYQRHMKRHAGDKSDVVKANYYRKTYSCYICGKTFQSYDAMICHRLNHKFKCSICNQVYNRRTTLIIHLQRHKETIIP